MSCVAQVITSENYLVFHKVKSSTPRPGQPCTTIRVSDAGYATPGQGASPILAIAVEHSPTTAADVHTVDDSGDDSDICEEAAWLVETCFDESELAEAKVAVSGSDSEESYSGRIPRSWGC